MLIPLEAIADHFAYASAPKFAEGQGATTIRVSKHLTLSENRQAEAHAKKAILVKELRCER